MARATRREEAMLFMEMVVVTLSIRESTGRDSNNEGRTRQAILSLSGCTDHGVVVGQAWV